MSEDNLSPTGTPVTPTAGASTVQHPAQQSRATAALIGDAQELITLVTQDTELAALLVTYGYDAAALAQGQALQAAAHQAYVARQQALSARLHAEADAIKCYGAARDAFYDFRRVARRVFKDSAARTALGLKGNMPIVQDEFMQVARTAYQNALSTPEYADVLARSGYPTEQLNACVQGLDNIVTAHSVRTTARVAALNATRARQRALQAMQAWFNPFRVVLAIAQRDRDSSTRPNLHTN